MTRHLTSFAPALALALAGAGAAAAAVPADPIGRTGLQTSIAAPAAADREEARRGRGADDAPGHIRRGRGADDPAGHRRRGRGADDPVGHG